MTDPYYCTLYIDTQEDRETLQAVIDHHVAAMFAGVPVEASARRNEDYEPAKAGQAPYDFILASRFYVELGTLEEQPDLIAPFQTGTAELVKALRHGRRFVTAACDFEDLLAEKTGWSWTKDDPNPPGWTPQTPAS